MASRARLDGWLVAVLILATGLIFTRLDNGMMWQDEAETAVLARNTLEFGYPRAFDGKNIVNPGLRLRDHYVWTYHPWLQFYVTAASFLVFGQTTWAARAPFALLGVVCVWLTYLLALRLMRRPSIARLAALLLALSVPFLLHARQCRYYTLSAALSLWLVLSYLNWLEGRRRGMTWSLVSAILLFHANHGVFIPTVVALGLHYLIWTRHPIPAGQLLWATTILALATGPGFVFLQSHQHVRPLAWANAWKNIQFHVRQVNQFTFPIVLWLAAIACQIVPWKALGAFVQHELGREGKWLIRLMLLTGFGFLAVITERMFRYTVYLIPWFAMLQAMLLWLVWQRRRVLAPVLAVVVIFTDVGHHSAGYAVASWWDKSPEVLAKAKPRSLVWDYLHELREPYRGPLEGVVPYLNAHALPSDTVKMPNETHSLMFYTKLTVANQHEFGAFERDASFPEWIVLARGWHSHEFFSSPYFRAIEAQYDRVELDVPDLMWQNRPDPGYHLFRTATDAPRLVMYRRKSAMAGQQDIRAQVHKGTSAQEPR